MRYKQSTGPLADARGSAKEQANPSSLRSLWMTVGYSVAGVRLVPDGRLARNVIFGMDEIVPFRKQRKYFHYAMDHSG